MSKRATSRIVRYRRDNLPPDETNWERVMAMTDEEITGGGVSGSRRTTANAGTVGKDETDITGKAKTGQREGQPRDRD